MHLILGGAVIALFALLSFSGHESVLGKARRRDGLLGAVAVAAVTLILLRAGIVWAAVGVAALWWVAGRRQ